MVNATTPHTTMIDRFTGLENDRGPLDVAQPSSSPGLPQKYLLEYGNYQHHHHHHHHYHHHHHHQPLQQQQQQQQLQHHQCSQTSPGQQLLPHQQVSLPHRTPLLAQQQQQSQKLQLLQQQQPMSVSLPVQQQIQHQQPPFLQPQKPLPPPPPPTIMCNATHQQLYHQQQQIQQQHQQQLPLQPSTTCTNTLYPLPPLPQHNNAPSYNQAHETETQRALSPASPHHPTAEGIAALKKEQARLQEQLLEMRERRRCAVCLDNEYGAIFMPCTHMVACPSCAATLSACPVCRAPVQYLVAVIVD